MTNYRVRGRPCIEYDIKRCIAPCVDTLCSAEEYGRAVRLTHLFLEGKNDELVKTLRQSGPTAIGAVKQLIRHVSDAREGDLADITARLIAEIRATDEAREGMAAFLEKRPPKWTSE